MIPVVLKQLERLQRELAVIDPGHDIDAAAQVAAIATALRETDRAMRRPKRPASTATAPKRNVA